MTASIPPWPSVGAVVPTRPPHTNVRRAVNSVLSQSYPGRLECVVVFDGGPTFDLSDVAPTDREDRSLWVIENRCSPGRAGARNAGADRAFAEILSFCTADDEWLPGKVMRQVAALEATGADVVVSGVEIASPGRPPVDRLPSAERVTSAAVGARAEGIHPATIAVRREAFHSRIGPFDEAIPGSYGEAIEWLLRAAGGGDLVAIREPLVRVHRALVPAVDWRTVADAISYLTTKHPGLLDDRHNAARLYGRLAFANAALGRSREARGWAWRSFRRYPLERRPYLALAISARLLSPAMVEAWADRVGRGV